MSRNCRHGSEWVQLAYLASGADLFWFSSFLYQKQSPVVYTNTLLVLSIVSSTGSTPSGADFWTEFLHSKQGMIAQTRMVGVGFGKISTRNASMTGRNRIFLPGT